MRILEGVLCHLLFLVLQRKVFFCTEQMRLLYLSAHRNRNRHPAGNEGAAQDGWMDVGVDVDVSEKGTNGKQSSEWAETMQMGRFCKAKQSRDNANGTILQSKTINQNTALKNKNNKNNIYIYKSQMQNRETCDKERTRWMECESRKQDRTRERSDQWT